MFSCIRSHILVKSAIEIKNYLLLRKQPKQCTAMHLAKQADIFTVDEIKRVFDNMWHDDDAKNLADQIAATLL